MVDYEECEKCGEIAFDTRGTVVHSCEACGYAFSYHEGPGYVEPDPESDWALNNEKN